MKLTIDASVFVAAARPSEVHHADSLAILGRVVADSIPVTCPALVLTEVAAALARTTGDPRLVALALTQIEALPGIELRDFTVEAAHQSAQLAQSHLLRGADAVYLHIALDVGATLVTLDAEMLARAPASAQATTPASWLTSNPPAAATCATPAPALPTPSRQTR